MIPESGCRVSVKRHVGFRLIYMKGMLAAVNAS